MIQLIHRKELEHNLQKTCVAWFRLQYPTLLLYAIPNGGQRNPVVGGKLKAEGVVAGIPDLHLACPSGPFHGLFIEMKTPIGRVTVIQSDLHAHLRSQGYAVEVVRSFEQFQQTIIHYLYE